MGTRMRHESGSNDRAVINVGATKDDNVYRELGNQCCYTLPVEEYHEEFGRAWSARPARCVAIGRGYVIGYEDGSVTWWDMPRLLEDKLKDQNNRQIALRFAAVGPEDTFFIKYSNGKMDWCASEVFGDAIREGVQQRRLLVNRVGFGANRSWLILWSDGSVEYENIPLSLRALLLERSRTPGCSPVKEVSMGVNDEWFLLFNDHSVRADNLSDSLYRSLTDIQTAGGRVRNISFGESGAWYCRYWDGN